MAALYRTVATLRVMGEDLIPAQITELLGKEPAASQSKGERIVGKNTGTVRIAKFGLWRFDSTAQIPGNLDDQIEEILSGLSQDLSVWARITSQFEVDLFCGLFMKAHMEGLSISPKWLAALGNRGIELGLDIYGGDDDGA
jgi:Domain of unknown function (DUF4279)